LLNESSFWLTSWLSKKERPRGAIGPAMHTNQFLAQTLINLLCCKSKIKAEYERIMNFLKRFWWVKIIKYPESFHENIRWLAFDANQKLLSY